MKRVKLAKNGKLRQLMFTNVMTPLRSTTALDSLCHNRCQTLCLWQKTVLFSVE